MIPHISLIPELTKEDEKTLEKLKGSEAFLIVAKVLAKEWRAASTQMLTCSPTDLVAYQGHARALVSAYNNIMRYANVDIPDNSEPLLPKVKKLRNMK
jgi:hypothetical protein